MSTDKEEWRIEDFAGANPVPTEEEDITAIFEQAQDALSNLEMDYKEVAGDTIRVAQLELRIMELTSKLDLASQIIDQQKATIARLKGDN